MRGLILALTLLASLGASAAEPGNLVAPWQDGQHYGTYRIGVAHGEDEVVVTEFFSYLCVHCFDFEPELEAWADDVPEGVTFERVHIVANRGTQLFAAAYAVAESCGVLEVTHAPLFTALHRERRRFSSADDIARFYAETVASTGVDAGCTTADDFLAVFDSFAISSTVSMFQGRTRAYLAGQDDPGVTGTPAMIVDGKWFTQGSMAGSNAAMLDVVDFLVRRARTAAAAEGGETAGR